MWHLNEGMKHYVVFLKNIHHLGKSGRLFFNGAGN